MSLSSRPAAPRSAIDVTGSEPGARPMPRSMRPGCGGLQQGELLGDGQRRVVGQHHARRSRAGSARSARRGGRSAPAGWWPRPRPCCGVRPPSSGCSRAGRRSARAAWSPPAHRRWSGRCARGRGRERKDALQGQRRTAAARSRDPRFGVRRAERDRLRRNRRGGGEDVVEHRRGEPAGEGVLLAGVVAADQRDRTGRRARRRVTPWPNFGAGVPTEPPADATMPAPPARRTRRARRSPARRRRPAATRRPATARTSPRSAGVGALSGGAHRTARDHASVVERQPVRGVDASRLSWPARRGAAPRTGSRRDRSPVNTRPVRLRAVRGGRQPDDQDPRRRRPRSRAPAGPSTARRRRTGAWLDGDLLAPLHQPRAGPAHADLGVELLDGRERRRQRPAPAPASSATAVSRARRVAGPAGAGRHRRVEHRAGARMRQLHPHTVHAAGNSSRSGPGRC